MTRRLERKIEKWNKKENFNYVLNMCNNVNYLIGLRKAIFNAYDLTEREKRQYSTRIDGIIRRQCQRMKTREYLEMLG